MGETRREMTPSDAPVRLGIVGCDAIAKAHLMAAQRLSEVEVTALVDKDSTRAFQLATEFQVDFAGVDYRNLYGQADAVRIGISKAVFGRNARYGARDRQSNRPIDTGGAVGQGVEWDTE